MKYGNHDVVDLMIFDEEENLVANLTTLKESHIQIDGTQSGMFVKDALLDQDLLKFIGKQNEQPVLSDYQKILNSGQQSTTITFNKSKSKNCKLIAIGYYRDADTENDVKVIYEIPKAKVINKLSFNTNSINVSPLDLYFQFEPFNEEGDIMKLHIEQLNKDVIKFVYESGSSIEIGEDIKINAARAVHIN
ncbi:hypothetical protein EDM57_04305 [Brevibacillus gelatini]|uniref:Uncharacterized protein n=1 Tax=Brevibacillus gelatini TaxID=1655277 RepID=A0A3M8B7E6_9BACL|nr:hypothetical protein [Brevibacillus gelatini]RNB59371.1 hypothetical protein EDM57_04305 [Brevibacillus gelatini]